MTWTIEVQDPHYWFYPALVDPLPRLATIPENFIAPIRTKLNSAVSLQNSVEQQQMYMALQQLEETSVFALRLPMPFERHYEQRWVVSPGYPTDYFYELKKE